MQSSIQLLKTNSFSKLFLDYITKNKLLAAFHNAYPNIENFEEIIKQKSKETIDRNLLTDIIKKQYQQTNIAEYPLANIEKLQHHNSYTITTGHQLCLFTGPLYVIYKIITTINTAKALKKHYPNFHFIPVFWLASEDHDFEEVNHANVFNNKLTWEDKQGGAVGNYQCDAITPLLDKLKSIMGDSENASYLYKLFKNCYNPNENLTNATRQLLNALFGRDGLVIIDGDHAQLKAKFLKLIKSDLFDNTPYEVVTASSEQLAKSYKLPVSPREINLFYLEKNKRNRIIFDTPTNLYMVKNTNHSFSKDQLKKLVEKHPERFSPNVVLRPLYQETILPNLAYIGGPSEIAYWLQLKALFDTCKIHFPILLPRNFALLLDKKTTQKLNKLQLTTTDLFLNEDELIKLVITKNSIHELNLKAEKQKLVSTFDAIEQKVVKIDASLLGSVKAEQAKLVKGLDNLESRIRKAEKRNQEQNIQQALALRNKLFPKGSLQERHENFIPYFLKNGDNFFSQLKKALNPFQFTFNILEVD